MIRIYEPDLGGREREYLLDAFDSSWISSRGIYIEQFEQAFSAYVGVPCATSVSSGTTALHLALHCLGIGPGDEVIVPSFTYVAPVNTILQTGATPVFVESRADDWLMDVDHARALITPRTRAILAVHLYGAVCDMDEIGHLAQSAGLKVIEDCAEAAGSTYRGRQAGSLGDVGTFSFFGNKIISTGEGGMVICKDQALLDDLRMVKSQGQDPEHRYWHPKLGFNYRMTNLAAAIGLGQVERIDHFLRRKIEIAGRYRHQLGGSGVTFQETPEHVESSAWLTTVLLPPGTDRDAVASLMEARGVETRPVFFCAHQMPVHLRPGLCLPVAEDIARRGISLPSHPGLTDEDVDQVAQTLCQCLAAASMAGAKRPAAHRVELL